MMDTSTCLWSGWLVGGVYSHVISNSICYKYAYIHVAHILLYTQTCTCIMCTCRCAVVLSCDCHMICLFSSHFLQVVAWISCCMILAVFRRMLPATIPDRLPME